MKRTTASLIPGFILTLLLSGCIEPKTDIPEQVSGLAPIYYDGDWRNIGAEPPQPIRELFKIYYKDSIIFAGESLRDKLANFYAQRTLTKSPITLADQAEAAYLLTSSKLSKTTGQILSVDGGLHEAFLR